MRTSRLIAYFGLLVLAAGCKERYEPELPDGEINHLVVEGYINPVGFTTVAISRTLPVSDPSRFKPEQNARVSIQGDNNSEYTLRLDGRGVYKSDSIVLNTSRKYRLHIKTANGGEYLSEYVPINPTPPIDSVYWRVQNGGVQIYVDTHDPRNSTRYYKWDYEETWEFHSAFVYKYKYVNRMIVLRDYPELDSLFFCWRTQYSSNVLTASSAHLTTDVISEAPIIFIPLNSEKIGIRYTILVKQYSLDRKAYEFYQMMRKNTESLGSIFDPQPSEITGNITCVSNSAEKAIGYITASEVHQKRIFISGLEIPSTYQNGCMSTYVPNRADSIRYYFETMGLVPFDADGTPPGVAGYLAASVGCVDCTLRGSSVKPSFW